MGRALRVLVVAAVAVLMVPLLGVGPVAADGNEAPGAPQVFRSITVGSSHTCALLDDGTVKCWGSDGRGQLGDGGTDTDLGAPPATPVDLGADRTATAITAGSNHTCALLDDATIKCWGQDSAGQLGDGGSNTNLGAPPATPVDLGAGRTATAITAGVAHTCALLDDATIKCWGLDVFGQLGDPGQDGTRGAPPALPVDLSDNDRTATAITAGAYHTCALLDDATVKCWGRDNEGQLGDGGDNTDLVAPNAAPIDLGAGRTATAITAGSDHTCALLDDATIKCWGSDFYGQLGDGGGVDDTRGAPPANPVNLGTGHTATAIAAGFRHTCVVLDNATILCWGRDDFGQLGHGGTNTGAPPATPVDLGTGHTATAVTAGSDHTCAVLDDASVKCWGSDGNGQLGDGGGDDTRGMPPASSVDLGRARTVAGVPPLSALAGTVTDVTTGAPVPGVWVAVLSAADYSIAATTTTDTTGHYRGRVSPGDYLVYLIDPAGAHKDGFGTPATTYTVTSEPTTAADMTMVSTRGAIAGTVTDDPAGTPVNGVWVMAIGSTGITAGAATGLDGAYTIAGLPTGTYRLTFVDAAGGLAQEYFDESPDYPGADTVNVTVGTVTTVDATLALP